MAGTGIGSRTPRLTGKKARIDISGQKFGMLTAVRIVGTTKDGHLLWEFKCDCGSVIARAAGSVKNGSIRTCGCQRQKLNAESKTTHGLSRTPEYQAWKNMLARCYDPASNSYADYGGRGITVCDRWRDSVEAFIEDMGPRPSSRHTIERRENHEPYSPENCVWAERLTQANNKRNNRRIEFDGVTRTLAEWGRVTGLGHAAIQARLSRGWTVEQALTLPSSSRRPVA